MKSERIPRNPEADVIADIDRLIDDSLARGESRGRRERCQLCDGLWHGLPGNGDHLETQGHPGAEAYVQTGNGGRYGCPGAYATSAARIRWRYRLVDPPGWYQPGPGNTRPIRRRQRVTAWGGRVVRFIDTVEGIRFRTDDGVSYPVLSDDELEQRVTAVAGLRRDRCQADPSTRRCDWNQCPRDSLYQSTVLAMQQYVLGCPVATGGAGDGPVVRYWDSDFNELPQPAWTLGQIAALRAAAWNTRQHAAIESARADLARVSPGEHILSTPSTPALALAALHALIQQLWNAINPLA